MVSKDTRERGGMMNVDETGDLIRAHALEAEVDYSLSLMQMLLASGLTGWQNHPRYREMPFCTPQSGVAHFRFCLSRRQPAGLWRHAGIEHGLAYHKRCPSNPPNIALYLMGPNFTADCFPFIERRSAGKPSIAFGEGGLFDRCFFLLTQKLSQ